MRAMFSLMSANEAMPLVRTNAQRALALEPSLSDAHAMLGMVAALYDYDWPEAGRRFEVALSREPVHPGVRSAYGLFYLMYSGRAMEARVTKSTSPPPGWRRRSRSGIRGSCSSSTFRSDGPFARARAGPRSRG